MGTNTLTDITSGVIDTDDINDIHEALRDDLVPRNGSGVPTNKAGSLGTQTLQWGTAYAGRFLQEGQELGVDADLSKRNCVISGRVGSNNEPTYLVPQGTDSLVIHCTTTPLKVDIDGAAYTFSSNITVSGMTTAPASNNTCLIDDAAMAAGAETRTIGEYLSQQEYITVDTMGSEITALVGSFRAFKVSTEFFIAYVTSITQLSQVMRGYFFDTSNAPLVRLTASNNDTITLLKAAWVFLKTDGTASVTYNQPTWSGEQPSSPSTNDRWYDFANEVWKKYNGVAWDNANEVYLGLAVSDTAGCKGARPREFVANYKRDNSSILEWVSVSTFRIKHPNSTINVAGKTFAPNFSLLTWNMASHLAGSGFIYNTSEQASRRYYFYMTNTGALKISDVEPYYRRDLFGFYHPHAPWRALGYGLNGSGSDFASNGANSWLSGNPDEQEYDSLYAEATGNQSVTTGAGYEDLAFATSNTQRGSGATFSTPNITITKRGIWRLGLFMQWTSTSGTAASAQTPRLVDSAGNTIRDLITQNGGGSNNGGIGSGFWEFDADIKKLGVTYKFQSDTSTTNATINRKSFFMYRKPGLYLGKE